MPWPAESGIAESTGWRESVVSITVSLRAPLLCPHVNIGFAWTQLKPPEGGLPGPAGRVSLGFQPIKGK
jgi:hypothetical protein